MIVPPAGAPPWVGQLVKNIQAEIELAVSQPLQIFTVANRPAVDDKRWLWRPYVLTDGSGNKWVVISDGTTLRYMEGTAV